MNLYLEAYDAAVLRYWGEMLARHHRSLRRPYARDWVRVSVDDDEPAAAIGSPEGAVT